MTTQADELREAVGEVFWNALSGITHEGQPWDHPAMRRYGGTCDARDNVLKISAASLSATALYLRANARSLVQHDDTAEAWVEKIIGLIEEAGRG